MMLISLILAVVCGVLAQQFHHTVGVAPMLAGLFCASCFLRSQDVAIVGIGAVLVRDVLGGLSWFAPIRLLAMLSVIGIWAFRVRPPLKPLLLGLGLSLPVYHLVLAIGDWGTQTCSKEPFTPQGLFTTIATTIPYFQRSLVSEMLFTVAFLSLYTLTGYLVALRWPTVLPRPSHG